jgi:hypothetical protein
VIVQRAWDAWSRGEGRSARRGRLDAVEHAGVVGAAALKERVATWGKFEARGRVSDLGQRHGRAATLRIGIFTALVDWSV